MELKIWVDGVERSVSGVSDATTCTQLIYALAHATGQKGKFVLVENYRGSERSLSPSDRPCEMLRKWKEKQVDVTYLLRRIDGRDTVYEDDTSSATTTTDSVRSLPMYARESSTSSIASVNLPYQNPHKTNNMQQTSSASLPGYSEASLQRRRPPPPDYNSTMERKLAGITHTSQTSRTAGVLSQDPPNIAERHLTQNELLNLIQKQDAILDEQRQRLKLSEMTLQTEVEREFIQLDAQQKNLKRVLESHRCVDWGRQYEEETLRNRQLRAKVLATQEKLSLIKESRNLLAAQEGELWQEIHDLSQEDNSPFNTSQGIAFPFAKNNSVHITQFHSAI